MKYLGLKPEFKYKNILRSKKFALFLIALGLGGLLAAGLMSVSNNVVPGVPVSDSGSITINPAPKPPSTKKPNPKAVAAYKVAPDLPKFISIPAINVSQTRVVTLGLLADNQVAVPDNVYDTGWYDGSAKPGQPGAMFIYGHLDGLNVAGVFWNLHKLKNGDLITITRGDNKKLVYKVVASKVYPVNKVDMNAVLSPYTPGTQGLNLMTCDGKYTHYEYNERLVVFTTLVSG